MEIEKLIEAIKLCGSSYPCEQCAYWAGGDMDKCIPRVTAEAADTLEQLKAENDRLQVELEKEEAARKKQADILYELRGQKYEQTTAIDQLRAENEKLKAERDLAINQLRGYCPACKNYTPNHNEGLCNGCKHEYFHARRSDARDNWEWRGPKEE